MRRVTNFTEKTLEQMRREAASIERLIERQAIIQQKLDELNKNNSWMNYMSGNETYDLTEEQINEVSELMSKMRR